jgi:hypothetical protein
LTELSPFYEPSSSPPTLPILIAQTEVGRLLPSGRLLAQEEIGLGRPHKYPGYAPYSRPAQRVRHPASGRTVSFHSRSGTPAANTIASSSTLMCDTPARSPSPDGRETSDLSSLSSDEDERGAGQPGGSAEDEIGDEPIPKPRGEAGRPGRGGYNLEAALAWDLSDYQKFKVGLCCMPVVSGPLTLILSEIREGAHCQAPQ